MKFNDEHMNSQSPSTQNNISKVLKEIEKTINTIGIDRLMYILTYSRENPVVLTQEQMVYADKIIQYVCEEFNITVDDLYSRKRKNNRRNALGLCAYFFEKYAKIDNTDSAYILKKPDDRISIYKKEMTKLNPNHPFDNRILEKIQKIEIKLKKI